MHTPHHASVFVLVSLLLALSFLTTVSNARVQAQRGEGNPNKDTARAIQTYHQGDANQAINLLQAIVKRPDDNLF